MWKHLSGILRTSWPILLILAVSLIIHFAYFGHPAETVFDEVHFGKFISGYFTHQYFFDIHPPLGKLLISTMGWLGGFKPGFSFAEIGQKFTDHTYLWLRLLPTLAGTILPLIIYFILLRIGVSRLAALTGGLLIALDNALLVQARYILLDAFLLLFGFTAVLAYLKYWQAKTRPLLWLYLASSLATLALSVKWTGATFLASFWIVEIVRWWQREKYWDWHYLWPRKLALGLIPLVVYGSIFAIHLQLLKHSGPGDAFMTPSFQKTLTGNRYATDEAVKSSSFIKKIIELNFEMFQANATLTAGHPYSSKWYTWPFMARPIYYWNENLPGNQINHYPARIYFLGNPLVWWGSTIAIFYLLLQFILRLWPNQRTDGWRNWASIILAVWLLNLLPFVSIKRAMFLYHYLVGMVLAVMALIWLIDQNPHKRKILAGLVVAALVVFIYLAPLSYGLPLPEQGSNGRLWFPAWH